MTRKEEGTWMSKEERREGGCGNRKSRTDVDEDRGWRTDREGGERTNKDMGEQEGIAR